MAISHEQVRVRRHSIAQLDTYDVTEDELQSIERECKDIGQDFQFASNCLSIGVSFFIALKLTKIDSPTVYACFFSVVLVMGVLTFYFGRSWLRSKNALKGIIQRIRERQVGPVGDEGHEMTPAAVAALPVTPSPPPQSEPVQPAPILAAVVDDLQGIAAPAVTAEAAPRIGEHQ